MPYVLICWVGRTDLRARTEPEAVGLGPIAQAVESKPYDSVWLISNYDPSETAQYLDWLQSHTKAKIELVRAKLSSPTDFGDIYRAAVQTVQKALETSTTEADLTFHLSPGTPAMAAVWIILAKTRFPATLIESSREHGVKIASVPFDISAEFIPDLMRRPDRKLSQLSAELPPEAPEFDRIVHRSEAMQRAIAKARRVAPRSVTVLIEGESGTGKELLARAIHQASPRSKNRFIAVNCGAIPSELIESELFGHEKGAFTGATTRRKGHFEEADGGTLFLDEIGDLPPSAQVKLLRVLQEGEVTLLGSSQPQKVDVRILSATNRTLINQITTGRFRADLFYRIAVAIITLPPLREREGDISLLIDHLLSQINHEAAEEPGYIDKKISVSARNLIIRHPWPGNVRELQNTLRRAAIWSVGDTISELDMQEAILPIQTKPDDEILGQSIHLGVNIREIMATVARHYLEEALQVTNGNKVKAAELLGLPNYQTLTNWMKKYGVQ